MLRDITAFSGSTTLASTSVSFSLRPFHVHLRLRPANPDSKSKQKRLRISLNKQSNGIYAPLSAVGRSQLLFSVAYNVFFPLFPLHLPIRLFILSLKLTSPALSPNNASVLNSFRWLSCRLFEF